MFARNVGVVETRRELDAAKVMGTLVYRRLNSRGDIKTYHRTRDNQFYGRRVVEEDGGHTISIELESDERGQKSEQEQQKSDSDLEERKSITQIKQEEGGEEAQRKVLSPKEIAKRKYRRSYPYLATNALENNRHFENDMSDNGGDSGLYRTTRLWPCFLVWNVLEDLHVREEEEEEDFPANDRNDSSGEQLQVTPHLVAPTARTTSTISISRVEAKSRVEEVQEFLRSAPKSELPAVYKEYEEHARTAEHVRELLRYGWRTKDSFQTDSLNIPTKILVVSNLMIEF